MRVLAAVLALPLLALAVPVMAKDIVLATGVPTGLYFPMGGALCRQVNLEQPRHGLRCLILPTDGPVDNLNALRAREVDVAMVQSDWQQAALQGEGRFAGAGPFKDLRAIASLHAETLTILVRSEAEIADLAALKGKRVNLGPRGSALRAMADTIVDTVKLRVEDPGDLAPDDAIDALCVGELDAVFLATGHPNAALHQAVSACGAVPLPVTGPGIDKLLSGRRDLVRAGIPGGVYPGLADDVPSVGVVATLVARADTDAAIVAELVRALLEQRSALSDRHPTFGQIDPAGMALRGRTAPLHEAADKAYQAQGPAKAP